MASVRKSPTGKFELTIRNKLLPKRVYLTFDTEAEALAYGDQVDLLLRAGVVPAGLIEERRQVGEKLVIVLRAWIATGKPAKSDMEVLALLVGEVGQLEVSHLTYKWAESWVQGMKLGANYSPGTIRKRLGALARALDWWLRQHPDAMVGNPLKLLPRGSSTYSAQDAREAVAMGKVAKVDVVRDRRLKPGELERIAAALAGVKRPDRERAMQLKEGAALTCLFRLIFYSGVRLREAYTLTRGQVDLVGGVLRIQTSKQWHGRVKWRNVPMRRELRQVLTDYLQTTNGAPADLLYPWWSGDRDDAELTYVSNKLSSQLSRVFAYAGCEDLREHDLRHEATCQWFEMRRPDGAWLFRSEEICSIMGWAPGSVMAQRYASFRAEDLAARLL